MSSAHEHTSTKRNVTFCVKKGRDYVAPVYTYFCDALLSPHATRLGIFDALLSGLYHGWPDDGEFDAIELVMIFI